MTSARRCDRRPRRADDAGLGDQAGHSVLRQDRARPRSADRASVDRSGTRATARSGRRRRLASICSRSSTVASTSSRRSRRVADYLDRLAGGDRAHGAAVDVRLVLAQHAQPRDRSHRLHEADARSTPVCSTVCTRYCSRPVDGCPREPDVATPRQVVGARPGAAGRRPVARGHRRAAASRIGGGIGDHEEHARLAAAATVAASGGRRPARGPRPSHRQLRPHDPAPRLQGRCALGPSRPQPGRRRRPTTRAGRSPTAFRPGTLPTLRTFLSRSRESGDRLHALWVLLATTGMRRGEAIGLRWKDVDLDHGRLRVVQTITQTRSKVTIGEPKTKSGRRSIALDDATVAVLRDHRKAMLEERMLVGPDFADEGLVFHQPDGACLRPDAVSAQFLRRVERYGLERLTLHGLRHTWATLALEQGIHPRVVQERLGHSTIAITLGIYSHVSPRPSTTRQRPNSRPSSSPPKRRDCSLAIEAALTPSDTGRLSMTSRRNDPDPLRAPHIAADVAELRRRVEEHLSSQGDQVLVVV